MTIILYSGRSAGGIRNRNTSSGGRSGRRRYSDFIELNTTAARIGQKAYGFPYDDAADQSGYVALDNPKYMLIAVGW